MNDQVKKPKKITKPEEIVLRTLSRSVKEGISSDKRIGAIAAMLRSFSVLLNEVGLPLRWRGKKTVADITKTKKKGNPKKRFPRQLQRFLFSLRDLSGSVESAEIAFWILDLIAGIAARLEGKLEKHIEESNLTGWLNDLFQKSVDHFEIALSVGEVESVQRILRFSGTVSVDSSVFLETQLKRIKDSTVERLPEVSRTFLSKVHKFRVEPPPVAHMVDPSQSVETQQLAHLLQLGWTKLQSGRIEGELYDSLLAYCRGFKNLSTSGNPGEVVRFSDETYEGNYEPGEEVVVKTPPVIWRSEHFTKVVIKGLVFKAPH